MRNVSAILLAAGESRRTGREHKLLFDFREVPLVRYVAEQLLSSQIFECIVVTGCQANLVTQALEGLPVKFVENKGFYNGMTSSIQVGVQHLNVNSDAFMLCLSDMPLLKGIHYEALLKKYNAISQTDLPFILRPVNKEQKGHPVIFDKSYISEILNCRDKEGCKSVLMNHVENLVEYPLANAAYYTDIDTVTDYYKLVQ